MCSPDRSAHVGLEPSTLKKPVAKRVLPFLIACVVFAITMGLIALTNRTHQFGLNILYLVVFTAWIVLALIGGLFVFRQTQRTMAGLGEPIYFQDVAHAVMAKYYMTPALERSLLEDPLALNAEKTGVNSQLYIHQEAHKYFKVWALLGFMQGALSASRFSRDVSEHCTAQTALIVCSGVGIGHLIVLFVCAVVIARSFAGLPLKRKAPAADRKTSVQLDDGPGAPSSGPAARQPVRETIQSPPLWTLTADKYSQLQCPHCKNQVSWWAVRRHYHAAAFACESCGAKITHNVRKVAEVAVFTCFVLTILGVLLEHLFSGLLTVALILASPFIAFWIGTRWGISQADVE
jgi:predicted RNA-binding Zn-ribbon protein involved in translation (DUF1610 family)